MGGEPLLDTLRVEAMFAPAQNPNLLPLHELRQANHALGLDAGELRPHRRRVDKRRHALQRSPSVDRLLLELSQLRLAPREVAVDRAAVVAAAAAAAASSEEAADRGVESERANESAEEDDEDQSRVRLEVSAAAGVVPPQAISSAVGSAAVRRRRRCCGRQWRREVDQLIRH